MSPLANRGSSFFYLPTHYSDIYSFPTRRSSDLGGILQETQHPFGIDARSFGEQLWRELRSEEHTSELQSLRHLVCRLLLEKKKHAWEKSVRQISQESMPPDWVLAIAVIGEGHGG